MPDHDLIYRGDAERYDLLVRREDWQGNIAGTLFDVCPFEGLDVAELGAGTGRLTCLVAPRCRSIVAYDAAAAMLEVARTRLAATGAHNWRLEVAENRHLPLGDAQVDVALAGWTIGHTTVWQPGAWQDEVARVVREMERVVRPGGRLVILETLGTGSEEPFAPTEDLARYYAWLEQEAGFIHRWFRTDYRFESVAEADGCLRFFFGDDLADRIGRKRAAGSTVVPECTGLWWRKL